MPPGKVKSDKVLSALLKEHYQSFILVAFDLKGNKVRHCDYETDLQGYAIQAALQVELNQHSPAPEVWVRNMVKEDED